MKNSKTRFQSGTFWGALSGAAVGLFMIIKGSKTGDWQAVCEGAGGIFAAYTAWRIRKGLTTPIERID